MTLAATVAATALISALVGDPQQVMKAFSEAELGAFVRFVLDRLVAAARGVIEFL